MTVFQLQAAASLGVKRNDPNPGPEYVLPLWEIKHKSEELLAEGRKSEPDPELIAARTAAIIWDCCKVAAAHGVNLDIALTKLSQDNVPKKGKK